MRLKAQLAAAASGVALAAFGLMPVQAANQNTFQNSFSAATNRASQPRFRWWWPGADVSFTELRREVNEIADAGFGGFEIADVYDTVSAKMDPKKYGWGTSRWNDAVAVVLDQAAKRHLTVDMTIGPHWPAVLPTITPKSAAAAKELVYGQKILAGGAHFSGKLPAPILPPSGTTKANPHPVVVTRLVGVLGVQCVSSCKADKNDDPVELKSKSVIDLSDKVVDGQVSWTAPAGGNWILLPLYSRSTGQMANMYDGSPNNSPLTSPRSYAIDNFSRAGTNAEIDYWDNHLLTPAIRAGLKKVGGAIFEDSLELKALQYWTDGAVKQFKIRRGYSVLPYLPVVLNKSLERFAPDLLAKDHKTFVRPRKVAFIFDDPKLMAKVRHDWNKTLSELWQENHLEPLQAWASSMGMKYRNQAYGGPIDSILAAATTGQPEGESLGFGQSEGKFQAIRAGRDMGNGGNLSDEMGAFFKGYATEWTADMLPTINRNFAYGVNQLYIHGYAYNSAPGTQWPGFAPFGTLFSEAWNGKQPSWHHIRDVSGYLTRTQMVLQSGKNKTDVAVLRTGTDVKGGFLTDKSLEDAGYTVGYLSPSVLDLPTATVADGQLNPTGPGYKALIVPLKRHLDAFAVQKVQYFAAQGLPVILVGTTKGAENSGDIAKAILTLRKQTNVVAVSSETKLPSELKKLKISADMHSVAPSKLRSIHRAVSDADFYYLFNDSKKMIREAVTLTGKGVPYKLDSWTGKMTPVTEYHVVKGAVQLDVALNPAQTVIYALRSGQPNLHAVTSNVTPLHVSKMSVTLRTEKAGNITAKLSDGLKVSAVAHSVAAPIRLSHWTLDVDAYTPGSSVTRTLHKKIAGVSLSKLVPWTQIPAVATAAGVGTYHTSFTLPASWQKNDGAYLTIGQHGDTIRVRVNGEPVGPVDQLSHRIDLGHLLQPGENTLSVEVTTPLNNTMLKLEPQRFQMTPFGKRQPLATGLIGTVHVVPYEDVQVSVMHNR